MLFLTVGFCVAGVGLTVLLLILVIRTVLTPVCLLTFTPIMILMIVLQLLPFPQILAGLLARLVATIALMALDSWILAGAFAAVPAVKISWHNNLC